MELKEMTGVLTDLGCSSDQKETAKRMYDTGQIEDLIIYLKKCRCTLMDEMHESQRKVDRMDFLIRKAEKCVSQKYKTGGAEK